MEYICIYIIYTHIHTVYTYVYIHICAYIYIYTYTKNTYIHNDIYIYICSCISVLIQGYMGMCRAEGLGYRLATWRQVMWEPEIIRRGLWGMCCNNYVTIMNHEEIAETNIGDCLRRFLH